MSMVPAFVLDLGYDFVAKNRYKWFGQASHCLPIDSKNRTIED